MTIHAEKAIDALMTAVEQLAANVMPGTPMPYRAPVLTVEQREAADRKAKAERLERVDIAPGDCPDPYRLEVAELLSDILVCADHWSDWAAMLSWRPISPPAHSQMASPMPFLRMVREHLHYLADEHQDYCEEIEQQARKLTARADTILGNLPGGQRLAAVCPFCGGRSDTCPVGGAHTLRVRLLVDGEPVIVCEGGYCAPESADCGTWWKGQPAWRVHEWDWLADRLGRVA